MSYRIEYRRRALRELKELPGHVRAEARIAIRSLASDPRPAKARELRDTPNIFRIWLSGHWRLAYEIDASAHRVRILRLRRKETIDYASLPSEVREPEGVYGWRPQSMEQLLASLRRALRLESP